MPALSRTTLAMLLLGLACQLIVPDFDQTARRRKRLLTRATCRTFARRARPPVQWQGPERILYLFAR